MVKAIRVHEYGTPEVMKWEDVEIGEPKSGEIKVKIKAIGVNFLDIYMRKGLVHEFTPPLPYTPGDVEKFSWFLLFSQILELVMRF
ncbi:putative NADPH:quinone reductase [Helianthus anomalus]